jgi:hypothetical protein
MGFLHTSQACLHVTYGRTAQGHLAVSLGLTKLPAQVVVLSTNNLEARQDVSNPRATVHGMVKDNWVLGIQEYHCVLGVG